MLVKQIKIKNLGLINYDEAFLIQEDMVLQRSKDKISDTLLFCSHPSVVTLGRGSKAEDLLGWSGEVKSVNRGGRATYHGPGQIVCYPIIKLKENKNLKIKEQDVRIYLESLEGVLIKAISDYGLEAKALSGRTLEPGQLNRGVWVGDKKIASIGIAIKKWVTMHGFALNFLKDERAFTGIKACGFKTSDYISMEELGIDVDRDDVLSSVTKAVIGFSK